MTSVTLSAGGDANAITKGPWGATSEACKLLSYRCPEVRVVAEAANPFKWCCRGLGADGCWLTQDDIDWTTTLEEPLKILSSRLSRRVERSATAKGFLPLWLCGVCAVWCSRFGPSQYKGTAWCKVPPCEFGSRQV